ncbi:MBL fold metallo-hydrolase [Bacillus testis]|uniref:MBL fold metallo-hydrolase n=1 Tax=Bacillus testis TaxID=1622072 RepID=UPI0008410D9B|nr:MBL fold metallo-hydrolase [Bacillus testis]
MKKLLSDQNTFKRSFLPFTSLKNNTWHYVTDGVWVYLNRIVNIAVVQVSPKELVIIDAGMPKDSQKLIQKIKQRFPEAKPIAIILTHGHFDHVGCLAHFIREWQVPVYASTLEMPYLTGKEDYPPGKITMKGLVSLLSRTFPNHGIDLNGHLSELPADKSVPYLPGWEWIPTPGHTPGHISLCNWKNGILIAGDAVVTVKQEALFPVIFQTFSLNGPPDYFTPDRKQAKQSLVALMQFPAKHLITGHGTVLSGREQIKEEMKKLLQSYSGE